MRKSKFMTKCLALILSAGLVLSGCGDKANVEDVASSSVEQSVENSVEQSTENSVEQSTENSTEQSAGSSVEQSAESSTEQSAESTESVEAKQVTDISQVSDWAAHYKEFFKNYNFDGKQMKFHFEGEESGMQINMDMVIGTKDGESCFLFVIKGQDGSDNTLSVYALKDKTAYLDMAVAGQGRTIYKTSSLDEDSLGSMNMAEEYVGGDMEQLEYVGEETIDGVLYDVLKMQVESEEKAEALYYVDREDQELKKIAVSSDELQMDGVISDLDKVALPSGLDAAEEVDSETFAMTMVFGLIGIIASASGADLSSLGE